jgi:hypothetical protein
MLTSHQFTLDCLQSYAESGDLIDNTNGVFAHSPVPKCENGVEGFYLTFEDHQYQGLLQSLDYGRCCFFSADVKKWLNSPNVWPTNFFDLWDIHDDIVKQSNKERSINYYKNQTIEQKESRSESIKEGLRKRSEEEEHHRMRGLREYNDNLPREAKIAKAKRMRDPFNARATAEDKRRIAEKARQDNNKPIEVSFPNGLIGVYPSANIAALFTGLAGTTLRNWARSGGFGRYGKNKGYGARYI